MRVDKRDLGPIFRRRLRTLIERFDGNQADFARSISLDRSALSQLLSDEIVRLPRAETLFALAKQHGVSLDWLLGLNQSDNLRELAPALEIVDGKNGSEQILLSRWLQEASGYKIRYVPCTIPDPLRTDEVNAYVKFHGFCGSENSEQQHAHGWSDGVRALVTDMEICMPVQQIWLLAEGGGIWHGLDQKTRKAQIDHMADLLDLHYPNIRLFLYCELSCFSVPYTVFGPRRAIIFAGDMYLVLNTAEHIRMLRTHFDNLIRSAMTSAEMSTALLRDLSSDMRPARVMAKYHPMEQTQVSAGHSTDLNVISEKLPPV